MTPDAEDRPTQVICPACEGAGYVVQFVSTTQHRGGVCACCAGTGIVTVARMREWKIAQAIAPKDDAS